MIWATLSEGLGMGAGGILFVKVAIGTYVYLNFRDKRANQSNIVGVAVALAHRCAALPCFQVRRMVYLDRALGVYLYKELLEHERLSVLVSISKA